MAMTNSINFANWLLKPFHFLVPAPWVSEVMCFDIPPYNFRLAVYIAYFLGGRMLQ
jgi:hypothetical protein